MNPNKYIHEKYNIKDCDEDLIVIEGLLRDGLYETFNDLGYRVGAEIGVRLGNNAVSIFNKIPELKMYLVDPWRNYPGGLKLDDDMFQNRALSIARRRVESFNAQFMRMFSVDAISKIPNNSLDFVYIDANHAYDYVMMDIILWTQKVRNGGIVSGHDYRIHPDWVSDGGNIVTQEGVNGAVTDYTRCHRISPIYLTYVPSPDEEHRESDTNQSWFFVKGGW